MINIQDTIKLKLMTKEEYYKANPDKVIYNRLGDLVIGMLLIALGVSTVIISKTVTIGYVLCCIVFKIVPVLFGVYNIWLAVKKYK